MHTLSVELPGLPSGDPLPNEYAGGISHGLNRSLPLHVTGVPSAARSVALAVIDVDARNFVHWLVVDLPPEDFALSVGASGSELPGGARELDNTVGRRGYLGPNPPVGSGQHRYVAHVYALDVNALDVDERTTLEDFRLAAETHSLATGEDYWTFENR